MPQHDSDVSRVPVLIVGSGPAGLATALSLARLGVRSMVVSRHYGLAHTPRAHITNQRTLEILADLGIAREIHAAGSLLEDTPYNVFLLTMAGPEVARTTAWGGGAKDHERYRRASPYLPLNLPQNKLEPVLAKAAVATGLVDLRFGHEFLSLRQDATGVDARILDRSTGREFDVRSDYLVGADGAKSRVMDAIGLSVRGETGLSTSVFAWITADLSRYVEHRPGQLYWGVDASVASWINVNHWDEWVAGWPVKEVPTADEVIERVRRSVGDPHLDVHIKSISTWAANHAAADAYSVGRVFCAGDAVHQHPPTNGLGSNTSIADGYNLAWKLQLALAGLAGDGLLRSYTAERAPVGRQIVDRAYQSYLEVFTVGAAAGLNSRMTDAEKWEAIRTLDLPTEESAERRAAVTAAMELMEYNFNAHGVELGYRYSSAAVIPSDEAVPVYDELVYAPTASPGEHLPHAYIERNRRRLSTLELVGLGHFTLITGRDGPGWREAAVEASQRFGVRIDVCQIGGDQGYRDPLGEWEAVARLGDDGCLLVRPDGHIAWRTDGPPDSEGLVGVMAAVLDREI